MALLYNKKCQKKISQDGSNVKFQMKKFDVLFDV